MRIKTTQNKKQRRYNNELTGLHVEQLAVATPTSAYEMGYKLDSKVIDHV